jgi:hypothetical protein
MNPRRRTTCLVAIWCCAFASLGPSRGQESSGVPPLAAAASDATTDWRSGWIQLFDQATTFGWRGIDSPAVQDGRLVLRAGDLARTSAQFGSCLLHLKYQLEPNSQAELILLANPRARESGVDHVSLKLSSDKNQITVLIQTEENAGRTKSSVQHWFGGVGEQGTLQPQRHQANLGRGYVGVRVSVGTVQIEQVSLLPTLGETELYSSLDKAHGFDTSGLGDARTSVADGSISLRGGPGYLATTNRYADFVLSIDASAGAGTNSGVFFRCIPGENLNGYESQIHNGTVDGNRALPADCGTGGIFRRVNARRVVADEGQWFRKVIAVCGGQISIWVNGYQVTDWSDQRPPNENPRRGRRLEAGTVMIQAHDPETRLDFKNLRVVELPAR